MLRTLPVPPRKFRCRSAAGRFANRTQSFELHYLFDLKGRLFDLKGRLFDLKGRLFDAKMDFSLRAGKCDTGLPRMVR